MNQDYLLFIKSIIKNYFRVLFLISIVGKITFTNTVQSYIASFLKNTSISKIIYKYLNIKLTIVYFAIYLIIQLLEVSLLYFSFTSEKKFEKLIVAILSFFLFVTVLALKLNIPGDCGCFGEILEFTNDIYKLIFSIFNLIIALIYILIKQKSKKNLLN